MEVSGKLGLLMATVIGLAATAAAAQDSNDPNAAPGRGQFFHQAKARILQNLKDREACVEAANDFQDMRACKPHGRGQNNAPPDGDNDNGGDDNGSDN